MPNIIFFDVDGTIISDDNYIPPSAVCAVRAARQAGSVCVVNTGRPYSHLVPDVCAIGFDAYVCSCGGHILLNDRVIFHDGFSAEYSQELLGLVRACRLDAVFEAEEGVWHLGDSPVIRKSIAHFRDLGFDPCRPVDGADFRFDKFCVWPNENGDFSHFLRLIEPRCEIIIREGGFAELVKRGCSKQSGMRRLTELLGIDGEDSYAIGDSTNDLPMLRSVRHSIAMGNAPDELKAKVEYVAPSLMEDGLSRALEHYGLV